MDSTVVVLVDVPSTIVSGIPGPIGIGIGEDKLYNIISTPIEYLVSENTTNNFIKDD